MDHKKPQYFSARGLTRGKKRTIPAKKTDPFSLKGLKAKPAGKRLLSEEAARQLAMALKGMLKKNA
ncbi:hypothetical protein ACFL5V_07460 [Fibrobacterota bacterium]